MKIILNRFWHLRKQLICNNINFDINNEVDLAKDREAGFNNGEYELLNNKLIAIFSSEGKNFLVLDGRIVELTEQIEIDYHVAEFVDKESWIKIHDKEVLIFELIYLNPHEPFILPDPFAYDEDFNTTNFAHHLAGYIKKVKENPDITLFSNNNESPQC
jgi:hypothetical protein